jgi:hypothetical protein
VLDATVRDTGEIAAEYLDVRFTDGALQRAMRVLLRPIVDMVLALTVTGTALSTIAGELLHGLNESLRDRVALPPRAADDWSLQLTSNCGCLLCGTTLAFASSRGERQKTWPLAQQGREHVMQQGREQVWPLEFTVLKQGSLHKLVISKPERLHEAQIREASEMQARLTEIKDALHNSLHAKFIILSATEQQTTRKQIPVYSFGDSYSNAANQLSAAAQTLAEYMLCICDLPEAALEAIRIADTTHYGSQELQEFRVTALLKLGRNTEAYEAHLKWRLNMLDVAQSEGYRAFVHQQKSQAQDAERQRISQLQFEYSEGSPASQAELEQLRKRFPNLSDAYVQWITQPHRHQLTVIDGEGGETYELFSTGAALEKHDELMGWLGLHDESSPELAEEIRTAIRESGIDPLFMLPIVGNDSSSDCFLLRNDGADAGGVYFWSHDECAVFTPIVSSAAQLFPWLQAQAEAGSTFSL